MDWKGNILSAYIKIHSLQILPIIWSLRVLYSPEEANLKDTQRTIWVFISSSAKQKNMKKISIILCKFSYRPLQHEKYENISDLSSAPVMNIYAEDYKSSCQWRSLYQPMYLKYSFSWEYFVPFIPAIFCDTMINNIFWKNINYILWVSILTLKGAYFLNQDVS